MREKKDKNAEDGQRLREEGENVEQRILNEAEEEWRDLDAGRRRVRVQRKLQGEGGMKKRDEESEGTALKRRRVEKHEHSTGKRKKGKGEERQR